MTVVAIFGNTVEFTLGNDKELSYMEMDEFVGTYGLESLGADLEVEEYTEGSMYKF